MSLFTALMIAPKIVSPILAPTPPNPPLALRIELIADCWSELAASLVERVVVVLPSVLSTVVVFVASRVAPIAPAICRMLGAELLKVDAANAPPLVLPSRNCAPSLLTVASDTSATIASTSTCSRRVSSCWITCVS